LQKIAMVKFRAWPKFEIRIAYMKRRTFRQLRARTQASLHHNVYVVLLEPAVGKLRKVRAENPNRNPKTKPCVYVGMTGLSPEERFANHKAGIKAASVVKRYGIRLLPKLYEHLNPMPYEAAACMEMDLAEDLRRAGYTVTGGH
jgi:hypothetical protein